MSGVWAKTTNETDKTVDRRDIDAFIYETYVPSSQSPCRGPVCERAARTICNTKLVCYSGVAGELVCRPFLEREYVKFASKKCAWCVAFKGLSRGKLTSIVSYHFQLQVRSHILQAAVVSVFPPLILSSSCFFYALFHVSQI